MKKIISLICFLLITSNASLSAGLTFSNPNARIKVNSGSTLGVRNAITGWDGTLARRGTVIGQPISFNDGVLDSLGTPARLTGQWTASQSRILMTSNQSVRYDAGQALQSIVALRSGNRLEGAPVFTQSSAISLAHHLSGLTLAVNSPLASSIALNGGTLTLDNDVSFVDDRTLTGSGTVNVSGRRIAFGGPLTGASLAMTSTLFWNDASDVTLNGPLSLSGTWTFNALTANSQPCILGNGNTLDLTQRGTIWVKKNTTLRIRNIKLKGLGRGGFVMEDKTSQVRLSRVEIEMANAYTMTSGGIYIDGSTTFVTKNGILKFDLRASLTVDGTTLWYDAGSFTAADNIQPLVDAASNPSGKNVKYLNGGTIREVGSGGSGDGTLSLANSNAILYLDTRADAVDVSLRTNSNALLYGDRVNSNALLYGDRVNSNALGLLNRTARTNSNALLYGDRVNSNALLFGDRVNSNAMLYGDRVNSQAIVFLSRGVRANSNALLYGDRVNSNAIVTSGVFLQTLKQVTGFTSWAGSGLYYDTHTTTSFTVYRGGTGLINSDVIPWSGNQTVTGLTPGNTYFIYVNSTGTLGKTTTESVSLFQNNIMLFKVLCDISGNLIVISDNHITNMYIGTMLYFNTTIGTIIVNDDNGANITLSGTQKISIAGEDSLVRAALTTIILDTGGVGVTFNQMHTTGAGKWRQLDYTDTFTGVYNNSGVPTPLSAGKYGVYVLYVGMSDLNASSPTYIAVADNAQYDTLLDAQAAFNNGTVASATNELKDLNLAQLGGIVYSQSSNEIVDVMISKSTLRSVVSTSGSSVASLVSTVVTSFDTALGASDTNVQSALDSIDNWSRTTSHAIALLDTRADAVDVLLRTNSNAINYLDSRADAVDVSLRTHSNALLYGDRVNSNAIIYLDTRVDAHDVDVRTSSTAISYLDTRVDAVDVSLRTDSNAMLFLTRNNSNAVALVSAYQEATKLFTGFASWSDSGAYYDTHTTTSFTLLRGGTGYINNKLVTWSGNQSVTGLTGGVGYLIYIDQNGTLVVDSGFSLSLYLNNIVLFERWQDPNDVQIVVKENHSYQFLPIISNYMHSVMNVVITNFNNGAIIALADAQTKKIQIDVSDSLNDHGLSTTIPDSGGVGVTFHQVYRNASSKWVRYSQSDTFEGLYNNAGTITPLSAGKFGVYTLYASKDDVNTTTPSYFALFDESEYDSKGLADSAISAGDVITRSGEISRLEIARLGYIIFSEASDSIVSVVVDKETLREEKATKLAALVTLVTDNFNGALNSLDTTVQSAMDTLDDWTRTNSNALVYLDTRADAVDVSLRTNSNALLYGDRVNSNAILGLLERADADEIVVRTHSNALLYGDRVNSNAILRLLERADADEIVVRTHSNALLYGDRVNSNVIVATDALAKNNSIFLQAAKQFTGFASWLDSGDYYDSHTTTSFTLLRGGTGYIQNAPMTWSGNQTLTGFLPGNTYFIYIDKAGTIGKQIGESGAMLANTIVLFTILCDAAGHFIVSSDDYSYRIPATVLDYLHEVVGTVIINENNGANITLSGTQKISIAGDDVLVEAGHETDILDTSGVGVSFHQMYTKVSGKWRQLDFTDTFTGVYNNAGVPTSLAAGKYGVYTLYAAKENLNSTSPVFIAVINNAQYDDLAAAQTALTNGTHQHATTELQDLELVQLGDIIYEQSSNSIVYVNIAKQTLRASISTGGTTVASLISTVVSDFDTVLSAVDTNVQSALDSIDDWGRTTSNAVALLDTRVDAHDVLLRTNSNALLALTRFNSNALLYGDRVNSNALAYGDRVNSNAIVALLERADADEIVVRTHSNALLYGDRVNSNAIVGLLERADADEIVVRTHSNALLYGDRNNSNAIKLIEAYQEPTKMFTGFVSWSDSGLYYDTHTTSSFTVYRGGTGYIKNKLVTWSGNQSVTGLSTGNTYWIYINSSGVLSATSTASGTLFTDNVILFEVMITPNNVQIVVKENHPYNFGSAVSSYLHAAINTIINNANNGANLEFVAYNQIGIDGADVLSDHGLSSTIPDSGGAAVAFHKLYRDSSGKWENYDDNDTFAARYNNAGTVTDPGAGYFVIYRLYVSKDDLNSSVPHYFAVIDEVAYSTLALARNAVAQDVVVKPTNELMRLEMAQLGFIIYSSNDGIVQTIISKETLRTSTESAIASLSTLVTDNFNGALGALDVTVQQAMDTLDDWSYTTSNAIVLLDARAGAVDVSLRTNSNALLVIDGKAASVLQQLVMLDHGPAHIHLDTTTTMSYDMYLGTSPAFSHKLFVHGGAPVTLSGSGYALHFGRETADTLIDVDAGTTLVLENVVLKDFLLRHIALGAGADVIFGAGTTVEMATDDVLPTSNLIKFKAQGAVLLAGGGHSLDISTQSNAIEVQPGAQLTLRDINVFGVRDNNLRCLSPSARIVLSDAALLMTNNYTFSEGAMTFSGDVRVRGRGHKFTYQSPEQSTIVADAVLTFDKGVTLSYDAGNYERAASNRQALALQTQSAVLHLDNCTLHSTYTGLQLTKGQLFIDNLVTMSSHGRALSEAITFGDGTAANDLTLQLLAGAELSVHGLLDYRNTQ